MEYFTSDFHLKLEPRWELLFRTLDHGGQSYLRTTRILKDVP